MKVLRKILAVLLVIVLFIGSYAGSFFLFRKGTFDVKAENLAVVEQDKKCYYLERAQKDITFKISGKTRDYELTDSKGKPVDEKIQKLSSNSFNILSPKGGYEEGKIYILTLSGDAKFYNRHLEKAKKLIFVIDREKAEEYKFKKEVIKLKKKIKELEIIEGEKPSDETQVIELNGNKAQVGDIIYGKNQNNEDIAYKIEEILEDGTVRTSIPGLDEILDEINLHNSYAWDLETLVANPALEAEIVENVRNSDFAKSITMTAYADDEVPKPLGIDVKLVPDEENDILGVQIDINLKPGKKGLFGIKQLKHQEVKISLYLAIKVVLNPSFDNLSNWAVTSDITVDFSWSVELSAYKNSADGKKMGDFFERNINKKSFSDYRKKVTGINKKLEKFLADKIEGSLPLFDVMIPCGLPVIVAGVEVEFFAELELAASLSVGKQTSHLIKVGLVTVEGETQAVHNISTVKDGKLTVSLKGKLGFKAGVKVKLYLAIVSDKVANAAVVPEFGAYLDLFVTIPINDIGELDDDKFLYCYFETGGYFAALATLSLTIAR